MVGMLALTPTSFGSTTSGTISTGLGDGGVSAVVITTPTASPVAGTYNETKSITLTATGATSIRYTTDGTTPTCSSTAYSSAISVATSTTIKALSCYPDSAASSVASFAYTLQCSTTSVSNGSVASYPSCAITCNSGYTL